MENMFSTSGEKETDEVSLITFVLLNIVLSLKRLSIYRNNCNKMQPVFCHNRAVYSYFLSNLNLKSWRIREIFFFIMELSKFREIVLNISI